MAVPTFEEFMLPALEIMADGKTRKIRELVELVASAMNLTEDDRKDLVPSQVEPRYVNRINWAIYYIMRANLLKRPQRGYYMITDIGHSVLKNKPKLIDKEFLMQFDDFKKFQALSKTDGLELSNSENKAEQNISTPQESIQNAYGELYNSLASDLLDIVKKVNPSFFEKLVVILPYNFLPPFI